MEQLREFTELLKGCRPVKDKNGNIVIQSIFNGLANIPSNEYSSSVVRHTIAMFNIA
jgi:hypothetical protein